MAAQFCTIQDTQEQYQITGNINNLKYSFPKGTNLGAGPNHMKETAFGELTSST